MKYFEYLYHANQLTDMESKQYESKKTMELERLCKQFLEIVEMQEKLGFPSKSYLMSKKKAFMLDVEFLLRSV